MNIKGLAKTKKLVEGMIDIMVDKIDDINWDRPSTAEEQEERFNDISDHLETIMQEIEGIEES